MPEGVPERTIRQPFPLCEACDGTGNIMNDVMMGCGTNHLQCLCVEHITSTQVERLGMALSEARFPPLTTLGRVAYGLDPDEFTPGQREVVFRAWDLVGVSYENAICESLPSPNPH